MSRAVADPAQMLVLAFTDVDSAAVALRDLRTLRGHGEIWAESVAVLESETSGTWSCKVEAADLRSPEGALIAALANVLVGTLSDGSVALVPPGSLAAAGKKFPIKRIDRGICSARLKPLRSYLPPGSCAIVALLRESEMALLADGLTQSQAIANARQVWVDLELDLDLLIADVLSLRASPSPVTIDAGLLGVAGLHMGAETAQVAF